MSSQGIYFGVFVVHNTAENIHFGRKLNPELDFPADLVQKCGSLSSRSPLLNELSHV